MKKGLCILLLIIGGFKITALAANNFTLCNSKYALCTTAKCSLANDKEKLVSCKCDVKTGYSAGTKPCETVEHTSKGQLIYSRYYPIKSYVKCSNERPWAWCLDSPCWIDKKNPSKAMCACSLVKNKGDYIIVTDKYADATCTSDLYSSATVKDANQVTDFLKGQKDLQPFPIKVINSP